MQFIKVMRDKIQKYLDEGKNPMLNRVLNIIKYV